MCFSLMAPAAPSRGPARRAAWRSVALAPLLAGALLAQAAPPDLSVADPAAPTTLSPWADRALVPPRPAGDPPGSVAEALARWQAANRAVAEFPRGHVDLLRWENRQATAQPTPSGTPAAVLDWATVWAAVQRQHPDQVLAPGASAFEHQRQRQAWVGLRHQTERLWIEAITAQAELALQLERQHAADTAAELAERMGAVGHWSRARVLPLLQAQSQARAALVQAEWQARHRADTLAQAMGRGQDHEVRTIREQLPRALPTLPPRLSEAALSQAQAQVLRSRPALAWQRQAAQRALAAVTASTWQTQEREWELALSAPAGTAPTWPQSALRQDHTLEHALEQTQAVQREAARLRQLTRAAWDQWQATRGLAELATSSTVPLARSAEQETLLRYNGMLQSTWDVIEAARARLDAEVQALQAQRAHWLAHLDWQALLAGADIERPAPAGGASTEASNTTAQGH